MIGYSVNEATMTIMLSGEIDHHSAGQLRAETDNLIRRYRPDKLVLNFKNVTFCDSSGIAIVLGRYRLMREAGGTVEIVGTGRAVEKIFKLAKLDTLMKIER